MTATALFNALIRTHHITSRKKVAKLRQAATSSAVSVLLRSGGSPGIMYVEGEKAGIEDWVTAVNRLKYKDYQLAARPAPVVREKSTEISEAGPSEFRETAAVKDFAHEMEQRGVLVWWRKAMGYAGDDHRI